MNQAINSAINPAMSPATPAVAARSGLPPWIAAARRAAYGIAGLILFIGIWKAALVWEWAPRGTLPDPFALPGTLAQEWQSGRLLPAIGSSLIHYFWGLAPVSYTHLTLPTKA